ncbi:hypothetical protein GCM10023339_41120 [Alloalcanivorax gelatiniphagus]
MTGHALRRRLIGFLATLAVIGVAAGLPVLLLAIGANPIPNALPSQDTLGDSLLAPDDGTLILAGLEVVAWTAWAVMTLSLLLELAAQLRGVRPPRLPGLALPQSAARVLIATAALLFITTPLVTSIPAATSATAAISGTAVTTGESTTVARLVPAPGGTARPSQAHASTTIGKHDQGLTTAPSQTRRTRQTRPHTVKPGESLWSIAAEHLGDGSRFQEIANLNREVVGDKPGFLRPGWVLQVPTENADTVATASYTVKAGDTLGTIARDTLGDADRYMDIYRASAGIVQRDGDTLTDPDLICPGWTLAIPSPHPLPRPAPVQGDGDRNQTERDPSDGDQSERDRRASGQRSHELDRRGAVDRSDEIRRDDPDATGQPERTIRPDAERTPGPTQKNPAEDSLSHDSEEADDSVLAAPWILAGLTGGGALLSGAMLLALQSRRRSQFRARRPGRTIASPGPELAPVEKSIAATGTGTAVTVEFTDSALRRLSAAVGAARSTMPPLAAVELGHDALTLHLSAPADLPAPWEGTIDRTHWHVNTGIDMEALGPDAGDVEPPYPLLLTIGTSDTGETWMLNCEELGCLTITGDQQVVRDLTRHLAAQLAVNPWSTRVAVDCIGIAEEVAAMDDRVNYHSTGRNPDRVIGDLLAVAGASIDRAATHDMDVSTARTGYLDDDVWPARILLLDAAAGDPPGLEELLQLIDDHTGQTSTSVVIAGDQLDQPGLALRATSTGRIILEHAELDLLAVGLTSNEARGCALLYAQRDNLDDVAVPVDETATDGWEAYADQTGGLRVEHTLPRDLAGEAINEPVTSLLQGDDEDYLLAGAAIVEDLQSIAPQVPASVRSSVEAADPDLDRDLADWFDPECLRPRLTLLGPVNARTHGKALAKRKPYFTELLAYLALRRRHGVTRDQICDAFGITPGKARDYINVVRDWLGTNPATGSSYLPHADKSPAAQERGVNVYQVDSGLLIDTDLFRRLNLRAKSRGGAEGRQDLVTALQLVKGRPFDQLRTGGWSWLYEGERHDEYALVAIADVAFTVVTLCLAHGDLARARAAAETARLAAPDEEVTRLCLVRIAEAEGDTDEARRILQDEICNRTDTGNAPTELSVRTDTIIRNHQWLAS